MEAKKKTTRVTKSLWWAICDDSDIVRGPFKTEAEAQEEAISYDHEYEWVIAKASTTNVTPRTAVWKKM